ncbi:protein SULFUR DEFICIENCY-INDUCED 2 [Musa acuminata AAA Group]|uniref:protein SULFUR DEFICIENCY-INDUCED 2 n=1 Tax=Musa acuminata AAA Group TaxID=214697 RepID=UPI0031DCCD42
MRDFVVARYATPIGSPIATWQYLYGDTRISTESIPNVDAFPSRFFVSRYFFLLLPRFHASTPLPISVGRPQVTFKEIERTEMEGAGWKKRGGGGGGEKKDLFHVIHKVPPGDSPYVRAKHLQLVEKDPDAAILWFWKAINGRDRVDSALKDMAVVMKQQNRAEEAVEAIRSFRHLCSKQAQESLDNLLIDLYKKCGRVEEQIELLKQKLHMIYLGEAFNGKTTKTARSHGKKFQINIKQETARILGNLGWAYMQQSNYDAAEVVYRKAQMIEPDANKACNLGLCLIRQGRYHDAHHVLEDVIHRRFLGSDDWKTIKKTEELMHEIDLRPATSTLEIDFGTEEEIMGRIDLLMSDWSPFRSRRLPIFEEISTFRDQIAC